MTFRLIIGLSGSIQFACAYLTLFSRGRIQKGADGTRVAFATSEIVGVVSYISVRTGSNFMSARYLFGSSGSSFGVRSLDLRFPCGDFCVCNRFDIILHFEVERQLAAFGKAGFCSESFGRVNLGQEAQSFLAATGSQFGFESTLRPVQIDGQLSIFSWIHGYFDHLGRLRIVLDSELEHQICTSLGWRLPLLQTEGVIKSISVNLIFLL